MTARHLAVLATALALAGCAAAGLKRGEQGCHSDDECAEGQVCFLDGCGDPGRGLVAEVSGDPLSGQFPQDFAIDAGLSATMNFELRGPLTLSGEFQREKTPQIDPSNRAMYTDPVLVRATGESELIPGVSRSFEAFFDRTERGTYSMSVGTGRYSVTALPADTSVPPELQTGVRVAAGEQTTRVVNFAFPSLDGALTIEGRLVKRVVSVNPPVEVALTEVAMDLQAFDPSTRLPLSQRIPPSSGTLSSHGDFRITLNPIARSLPSVIFVATPRVAGSLAPSKTFAVSAPLPTLGSGKLMLEVGDFGERLPQVKGQLKAVDGQAVVGASVLIEGSVGGGGQFRSKIATTDATGSFVLDLLANAPGTTFTLQVVPPPESRAAAAHVPVKVVVRSNGQPALDPPVVTLTDRLLVSGTVYQPNGIVAQSVRVRAVERAASQDRELPLEDVEGLTDEAGRFTLRLDPGTWVLEFVPGGELPRTSRVVVVRATVDNSGVMIPTLDLSDFFLSRGRRVSGVVTASSAVRNNAIVPWATVRFFHVAQVEGKPSAVLMATGTTDEKGIFTVVLPTASTAATQTR